MHGGTAAALPRAAPLSPSTGTSGCALNPAAPLVTTAACAGASVAPVHTHPTRYAAGIAHDWELVGHHGATRGARYGPRCTCTPGTGSRCGGACRACAPSSRCHDKISKLLNLAWSASSLICTGAAVIPWNSSCLSNATYDGCSQFTGARGCSYVCAGCVLL